MRLADFILRDMEAILAQWETFAATRLPAAAIMSSLVLRDHARQILEAVATDLSIPQSQEAQTAKGMGLAPKVFEGPETAAETHAVLRARSGFDINQLASEYRALRASVLRLWTDACQPEELHLEDIIRFNEAIDQALAESIAFFSAQVDQARNLFLGMLGHDMRSPLQTIQMTASYLAALNAGTAVSEAASRMIRSGVRIQALVDDLVDFNRTKLGMGIHIAPTDVDLATLFDNELGQLRAAYPHRRLELNVTGDTRGFWDGLRLARVLANLVINAIKYGASDTPVRVVVSGKDADVCFEVRNTGSAIEGSTLEQLFEPLKRAPEHQNPDSDNSLGLGLYISREIAKAHGGEIKARSEDTEIVFAVRLPRCLVMGPAVGTECALN
jgi:signal transduction histidine kinase